MMLINPSIIILYELFLFDSDICSMVIFYDVDLGLILLLGDFSNAVAEIYLGRDLEAEGGKLVVELLTGEVFLGEELLLLVQKIDFVGLLEGLDL